MKKELPCCIVQDILPNYIEKLTSDETNQAIENHMSTCEECKKACEQMNSDLGSSTMKAPAIEMKFLKKFKITKILAAVIAIILALNFSYMLYVTEYKFSNDKNILSSGITEFLSQPSINAYVLETKEVDGKLVAAFKDSTKTNVNGVAIFAKGLNQKYRIISAEVETSDYSAVLQVFPIEIKNKRYLVVSGYNLSDKIKYYGLDYNAYTNPDGFSKDQVKVSIKFNVKNQQFIEIYSAEYIDKLFNESMQNKLYNPHLIATSMYDADGTEITEIYRNREDTDNSISSSAVKEDLWMIYISMCAVMELGVILMAFFLTDIVKEKIWMSIYVVMELSILLIAIFLIK